MRSARAVVVLLALGLAGCGIPTTGPISFGEPPQAGPIGEQLYFILDDKLRPTLRPAPSDDPQADVVTNVVDRLVAGPLPDERAAGITTEVPPGLGAFMNDRQTTGPGQTVDVYLFGRVANDDDPTRLSTLAAAQLVCTIIASLAADDSAIGKVRLRNKRQQQREPLGCPLPLPG
jgi:hypothetical protein